MPDHQTNQFPRRWSGADMRCPKCNQYLPDRCTCNGPSIEERRNMDHTTDKGTEAERAPRSYLDWWTSIETDVRKSMLVWAHRDTDRLHSLVKMAYEAGAESEHQARAGQEVEQPAAVDVKQWHERTESMDDASIIQALKSEVFDLRAQLASERQAKEYEQRHAVESEAALAQVQAELVAARRAAPTQPKAQIGSIDTPEFRALVRKLLTAHNQMINGPAGTVLVAHIDAWAGSRAGDAVPAK